KSRKPAIWCQGHFPPHSPRSSEHSRYHFPCLSRRRGYHSRREYLSDRGTIRLYVNSRLVAHGEAGSADFAAYSRHRWLLPWMRAERSSALCLGRASGSADRSSARFRGAAHRAGAVTWVCDARSADGSCGGARNLAGMTTLASYDATPRLRNLGVRIALRDEHVRSLGTRAIRDWNTNCIPTHGSDCV